MALVLGCGDSGTDRQAAATPDRSRTTLVYECERGLEFVTAIRGDTAWAFLPDGTVPLPHVVAAPGAKYSDGALVLWATGEEAVLEIPPDSARACRNNRARAVWEHAKLGGADFRAVGNEPGWHLEIGPDSIRLVTDYGETRSAYPTPAPETDRDARHTTYRTASGDDTVRIELRGERCLDTMSGEEFETAVMLTLGERTLRGCGRALH
jgi:uncharacterized membrane protein